MFNNLPEKIANNEEKISLIGLGYVGLPIAVSFAARGIIVIGYDNNVEKVECYKSGIDPTKEVGDENIKKTSVIFTTDPEDLKQAKFHIVAVPTPITEEKVPDLKALESASEILGKNLSRGSIVVYESTVYPGVTEEICIPILEKESGLVAGVEFKVGYSPERINPGDKINRLENIVKVVSGQDQESLDVIAKVYEIVVDAGIYKAESIKIAEAAKVIENSQRDINIAFINELSIIFNKMGIDTQSVLNAASTKWNFLRFTPGLVGGHCIGVDPYYLTYRAKQYGYISQVILAGRRINDGMGKYIAENLVKKIILAGKNVKDSKVAILGFTFKENCPDIRNTKVMDIVEELREYGINPIIADPQAEKKEAFEYYGITFSDIENIKNMDAIVIAVAHNEFIGKTPDEWNKMFSKNCRLLFDIKGILDRALFEKAGYEYWRL